MGTLIVFEGPEGAGKTTQIVRLAHSLESRGVRVRAFREPGGTPLGDEIRRLLLNPESSIGARAEVALFLASRAELVEREIRPALEQGETLLLDRFFLSTYAYQVYGRGLAEEEVRVANGLATGGLVPDLTLLVQIPFEVGLDRAASRGGHDRIEAAGSKFHQRVARAFAEFATSGWQAAHPECGPIAAIDGVGSADEVFARISLTVRERLPSLGLPADRALLT